MLFCKKTVLVLRQSFFLKINILSEIFSNFYLQFFDQMKNFKFLIIWSLLTLAFLTLGYFVGYIAGSLTGELFGLTASDDGTHLIQTIVYCVFGSVVVTSVSLTQLSILKKYKIKISKWWVSAGILGIVISEIISGIILWQMEINRSDLGIFQGGPQPPEALIFSLSGLLIGIFQRLTIRKQFTNSIYWIPANFIGWGFGHLVMFRVVAFFPGALLLGIITGLFFIWIIKSSQLTIK